MNYKVPKINKLLVKQKIISYTHFPIEATLCDYAIDEPTTLTGLRSIVFRVTDSIEVFIMNFADEMEYNGDPLSPLSSSKKLSVTSRILKEL